METSIYETQTEPIPEQPLAKVVNSDGIVRAIDVAGIVMGMTTYMTRGGS